MILIFGGTTQGKAAAKVCDSSGKPFYYSTKSSEVTIESANGIHISGVMESDDIEAFCIDNDISLIINASHPFAMNLHRNISKASHILEIPVIRFERNYPERNISHFWFSSYGEVLDFVEKRKISRLVALTGVNSIEHLKPFWKKKECWIRIINRKESLEKAAETGFPSVRLLFWGEGGFDDIRKISPEAILTKESGDSGRFSEKTLLAKELDIPLIVLKRDTMPLFYGAVDNENIVVYGENTLRRKIEKLYPEYFDLKSGLTTGSCATAASKSALELLLTGKCGRSVEITLPSAELVSVDVRHSELNGEYSVCEVVKDAGDDPDITNGLSVIASVRLKKEPGILIKGGKGVGIVTMPGLGIPVGDAAINPIPRKMIEENLTSVLNSSNYNQKEENRGVVVEISVPKGEEISLRTFNPKLGIKGGISIIGTSGVVKPFSSEAFVGTIDKECSVASALGINTVVFNSGAKSEKYVKLQFPNLSPQSFVHFGNYIEDALKIACKYSFSSVFLVLMIGKAVKLAEGHLDTHSRVSSINRDFLADMAIASGCPQIVTDKIRDIVMARELWDIVPPTPRYQIRLNNGFLFPILDN